VEQSPKRPAAAIELWEELGSGLAMTHRCKTGHQLRSDLARSIGRVSHAKTHNRIVAGGRTRVYVN